MSGEFQKLQQVLVNLMTNAYDAIQKKAGMIQANQIAPAPNDPSPFKARIWISASVEKKEDQVFVVLQLQDNGIARAIKLDYADFSIRGTLEKVELLPKPPC